MADPAIDPKASTETPTPAPGTLPPMHIMTKPKGFDPTGRSYKSYEQFVDAWQGTKTYLKLPSDQRVASFSDIRNRWYAYQDELNSAEANKPDFTGQVNEAVGNLAGKVGGPVAKTITQGVLPSTNAQAAIDAVLFASGTELAKPAAMALEDMSAAARMAARVATPGIAGAIGGSIQGGVQGAETGGASGVTQGVAGELVSGITGVARRAIQRADVKGLGEWLRGALGESMGDTRYSNITKINNELVGGEAEKRIGSKLAKIINKGPIMQVTADPEVARLLKVNSFNVPVSFKEVNENLEQLENIGWDTRFRMQNGLEAQKARSAVHQYEGQVAEQLDQIDPKLAQQWYTLRGQVRTAKMMGNVLRDPGVIENGKLNIDKLQALFNDYGPNGYKMDMEQALGPQQLSQFKQLLGIVRRGGTPGAQDVPGQPPKLGISYHIGLPHPWMTGIGKFPRHTGYIPFDLGRGRAFTGVMVLGAHQFVNNLGGLPDDPGKDVTP